MSSAPAVSVVMAAYNAERFVAEATRSILAQTFRDFECIIVDDGSTDRTAEILDTFRDDARVVVLRHAVNRGFREALNTGCRAARGALIARMDADDVCLPDRLTRQVSYLDEHPDVGVLGSGIQLIDEHGVRGRSGLYVSRPGLTGWLMLFTNVVGHPTTMIRRSLLEQVGYYPSGCSGGTEDYALFMALTRLTRITSLPEVLLLYRSWGGNMTRTKWEAQEADARRILRECAAAWWQIELTPEDAGLLRGLSTDRYPVSAADLARTSSLIDGLLAAFLVTTPLEPHEARAVRRDAGIKQWLIAALAVRRSPRESLTAMRRAMRTSPGSAVAFAAKVTSRLARR